MMTNEELATRFAYHAPTPERVQMHEAIRAAARTLAEEIRAYTPECREQSLAFTATEEAMMWANAAIARRV